jgi:hypothetical protein
LPLIYYYCNFIYCNLIVSDGLGILVVVSTGVCIAVSDGWVTAVSLIGGDVVSDPVDSAGVSQPIVAIAKKAMKRMLFMRKTLELKIRLCHYGLKKAFHH